MKIVNLAATLAGVALATGAAFMVVARWGIPTAANVGLRTLSGETYAYDFHPGETWQVALNFRSEGTFALHMPGSGGIEALKPTPLPFILTVTDDQFQVYVAAKKPDGYELFLRTTKPRLAFGLSGKESALSDAQWSDGVLVTLDKSGHIDSLRFPSSRTPVSDGFYRVIAAAFFPVLTQDAVTTKLPGGLLTSVQKIKSVGQDAWEVAGSFTRYQASSPHLTADVQGQSTTKYAKAALAELELSRVVHQFHRSQLLGTDTLSIKAQLVKAGPAASDLPALAEALKSRPFATMSGQEEFADAALELANKAVAGTTFAEAKAWLDAKVPEKSLADDPALYQLLKAWLVVRPEMIPEIAKELDAFDPGDPRFDLVGILLAKASDPKGQRELISRINAHLDSPKPIEKLVFSLALTDQPTTETAAAALAWLNRLPLDGATYVTLLPLAAGVGYNADASTRKAMADAIVSRGLYARDNEVRLQAANALGNLGFEGTLAKVQGLLRAANADERSLGVTSLRRVQGPEAPAVTEILTSLAATDPDLKIRRLAASHLGSRAITPGEVEVLARRLREEKDPTIAVNIVQAIGASAERQLALATLNAFNGECGHPAVCRKVEHIILLLSQDS